MSNYWRDFLFKSGKIGHFFVVTMCSHCMTGMSNAACNVLVLNELIMLYLHLVTVVIGRPIFLVELRAFLHFYC